MKIIESEFCTLFTGCLNLKDDHIDLVIFNPWTLTAVQLPVGMIDGLKLDHFPLPPPYDKEAPSKKLKDLQTQLILRSTNSGELDCLNEGDEFTLECSSGVKAFRVDEGTFVTVPSESYIIILTNAYVVLFRSDRMSIVLEVVCICGNSDCHLCDRSLVMKLSYPSEGRQAEDAHIKHARTEAEKSARWALQHLPELFEVATIEYDETNTPQGETSGTYERCVLRVTIMEKLEPLEALEDLRDYAQVFYDILQGVSFPFR